MSYFSHVGPTERIDLLLLWVVLVIGFSLVIGGRRVPSIDLIVISALGVGTGFLFHELAHKFIANDTDTGPSTGPTETVCSLLSLCHQWASY